MSPATKARLAALPKGELLVRHPHFTQPIFVRFPRPPVLSGREGIERFPPAAELPFGEAVARRLRALDRDIAPGKVADLIAGRREEDVRKALNATIRSRPESPLAFFVKCLGREVRAETPGSRPGIRPIRSTSDPY
jgi:hypothetical protein